ncbi:1-phosphofructokinase family hexose kinase [Tardiphaga sp. vice352]|uniref:1-phosphofructokinase family hexose kinase n=1 Tax=unclassified Tardiphaga TaxID=2631404 RepID=UPI0011637458|nr:MULTISPECIES: 1-phosphofructokinase family hexose kinase [unclassified Tardiphaga]MBC7583321.1 1-phosphofructokinase family hexose kinase [Tardiphaga sp.]QDM19256.1 1-phosphofructokinase family hexose kinase [Tardiphaga sp. vice278]QDM24251.1 1-phosphofructokinase family hexose kinase [Tardiphaga sp. vice154]QDM29444.1 1-phosphofructokinase family hexose kinase [Tardiphaga sp. vice304]QDM34557.1 1-phosphofructokinase family hexose kinase [Tardiphaga sp. vice352]
MAAPGIVTLTINPAVDISTSVKEMLPFTKMRCAPPHRDPGGGGINVARVLKRLGVEATAVYPAGGATGQTLAALLEGEGVPSLVIPTLNDTREDITIHDESSREQFRLVFPGAVLSEFEWQQSIDAIARLAPEAAFVIASGSLPAGVPADFYGRVVRAAHGAGKVIVDTSGASLRSALEEGVYLIKPNLHEFQDLAGVSSADDASLVAAGRHLFGRYRIEVIALSMGAEGALLMTRDAILRANGFPIEPASVSGAGDSFLGAMVWSLTRDGSLESALRYGVAGGSAALLNPGTELCRAADVHRLAAEVTIRSLVEGGG